MEDTGGIGEAAPCGAKLGKAMIFADFVEPKIRV
jgi:hypothetical protein